MLIILTILIVLIMCQVANLAQRITLMTALIVAIIEEKKKKEEINNNLKYN